MGDSTKERLVDAESQPEMRKQVQLISDGVKTLQGSASALTIMVVLILGISITVGLLSVVFYATNSQRPLASKIQADAYGYIKLEEITLDFFIQSEELCNPEKLSGFSEPTRLSDLMKASDRFYEEALKVADQYNIDVISQSSYINVTEAVWRCIKLKEVN